MTYCLKKRHNYSPPSEDTFCFFIKKEMTYCLKKRHNYFRPMRCKCRVRVLVMAEIG